MEELAREGLVLARRVSLVNFVRMRRWMLSGLVMMSSMLLFNTLHNFEHEPVCHTCKLIVCNDVSTWP